jgi:DNA-binding transcriptional regulator YiaG
METIPAETSSTTQQQQHVFSYASSLKAFRESLKITQKNAAIAAGVNIRTWQNWESESFGIKTRYYEYAMSKLVEIKNKMETKQ